MEIHPQSYLGCVDRAEALGLVAGVTSDSRHLHKLHEGVWTPRLRFPDEHPDSAAWSGPKQDTFTGAVGELNHAIALLEEA